MENIAEAIDGLKVAVESGFASPNESDSNGEVANIVDVLAISGRKISSALLAVASAIGEHTEVIAKIHGIEGK